jgi:hypothetical protein
MTQNLKKKVCMIAHTTCIIESATLFLCFRLHEKRPFLKKSSYTSWSRNLYAAMKSRRSLVTQSGAPHPLPRSPLNAHNVEWAGIVILLAMQILLSNDWSDLQKGRRSRKTDRVFRNSVWWSELCFLTPKISLPAYPFPISDGLWILHPTELGEASVSVDSVRRKLTFWVASAFHTPWSFQREMREQELYR